MLPCLKKSTFNEVHTKNWKLNQKILIFHVSIMNTLDIATAKYVTKISFYFPQQIFKIEKILLAYRTKLQN